MTLSAEGTNRVRELIDHILVSEELVPLDPTGKRRIKPSVNSHPDLEGMIESVGPGPSERKNKPASDHAPVTAVFKF